MKSLRSFAVLSVLASSAWASAALPPEIDTLTRTKNCMICHAVDKKLVGPSFTEAREGAIKRGVSAEAMATKIHKGGSGVYGPVPMPAMTQLTAQEALTLAKWFTAKDAK